MSEPTDPPRRRPRYRPTHSQPIPFRPKPPECPVFAVARRTRNSARALARTLRRLRSAMRRCPTCPFKDGCPSLEGFNTQIDSALQEIADEWSLK